MKKLTALFLALIMMLAFAACGGGENEGAQDPTDAAESTEGTQQEVTEAEAQKVTIGDYTVEYDGAVRYKPYESEMNPAVLVVYFNFTNNASEAYIPYTRIFVPAEQNGETLKGTSFSGEYCPVEDINYEKNTCAPGETVRCSVIYKFTEGAGNVDVTFMDNFHTIEEKMVISIDPASLELVTAPLGVAE